MRYITVLFLLLVLSCASSLYAEGSARSTRPKICLVLKGGGALGSAHVGVLKVLEQNRIPVDCIAGTSMGSIIGAAYASGNTMEQMERLLIDTDWDALFGEKILRENKDYRLKSGRGREIFGDAKLSYQDGKFVTPAGAIEGQNIRPLFQHIFGDLPSPVDFDSLPIPFRAVTANIETGEKYVPASGDLATVVRASMSVPGAFSPVHIDGKYLVDGGIANNLPIEVALDMGADVLIVVDLQSTLAKGESLDSLLSVTGQMINLLFLQNTLQSQKLIRAKDVVVTPDVSAYNAGQFDKGSEIMTIGEKAANAVLPQLKKLAVSPEEYSVYLKKRTTRLAVPAILQFVRLENNSPVADNRILKEIRLKPGDHFDNKIIEEDIQKIYQSGQFETVQYTVVKEDGREGLKVEVQEKAWLKKFAKIGFSLEDNLDGGDTFRLGFAYRANELIWEEGYGELQAEIGKNPRIGAELYQMLGESEFFVDPILSVSRNELLLRDGGTEIAEYQRSVAQGVFYFGRRLGTLGEATLGVARGHGEIERKVGDPALPEANYNFGDFLAGFELDNLDTPDFPTSGFGLHTKYTDALEELGSDDEFGEISGGAVLPLTFGNNTILLGSNYAQTFGTRPIARSNSLGGFLSVSGYQQGSLTASDFVTGQMVFYHRISRVHNPLFDLSFFVGGSYELTNINNDLPQLEDQNSIQSGSVFLGGDTPILPIYLGFGMSDTNEKSIYVNVGRIGRPRR